MQNLLTKDQVAKLVGLAPVSVMRAVREGRFPRPIRLGPSNNHPVRFVASDVERWLRARMDERLSQSETV